MVPEKKYMDLSALGTTLDETPGFLLLNPVVQGTSSTTRIGKQITMKSLLFRFFIRAQHQATTPGIQFNNACRLIIVYDLQPNGVAPSASDLLENTLAGLGIVSPLQRSYSSRWKVLYDKMYMIQSPFVTASGAALTTFAQIYDQVYLKMNHTAEYDPTSNTGTFADLKTGALWLVALSDNNTLAQQPLLTYWTRLRYTDV